MNPVVMTVALIVFLGLVVWRHYLFERNMRRAKANGTGLYRYSPRVRRVILVIMIFVVVGLEILRWHLR